MEHTEQNNTEIPERFSPIEKQQDLLMSELSELETVIRELYEDLDMVLLPSEPKENISEKAEEAVHSEMYLWLERTRSRVRSVTKKIENILERSEL